MTQNRDFSSVYSLASRIMTALLEDTAMMADQCDEENKQ
jgi:hypothetical protein